eukprot:1877345-Amphidinium_carterae.1
MAEEGGFDLMQPHGGLAPFRLLEEMCQLRDESSVCDCQTCAGTALADNVHLDDWSGSRDPQ